MSWKRFSEFRDLKTGEEDAKQSSKRKSLDSASGKVLKRRRRSLCFSYALEDRPSQPEAKDNIEHVTKENKIGCFSSSDEEKTVFKGKYSMREGKKVKTEIFEKNAAKPKGCGDESSVKRKINQKLPAKDLKNNTASSSISTINTNLDLIDWSSSDSESVGDRNLEIFRKKCPLQPSQREKSKNLDIEKFDSPIKRENEKIDQQNQNSSQISITESSPSPKCYPMVNKQDNLDTDNGNYPVRPIDSSKKKRRDTKGGLAGQLKKLLSRENSELVFWKHSHDSRSTETKDSSASNNAMIVKILCKDIVYSLSVLKCQTIEDEPQQLYLLMSQTKCIKRDMLFQNTLLKVFPPWKKLDLPCTKAPVLMCVYYFEILSDLSEIYNNDIIYDLNLGQSEIEQTNLKQEATQSSAGESEVIAHNFEPKFIQAFNRCDFWRKCCFSAIVKRVFITMEDEVQVVFPKYDTSLVECFKRSCGGNKRRSPNIMLLLQDFENMHAVVNLTLSLFSTGFNGLSMSNIDGCTINFKEFVPTGLKNAFSDPPLFTLLNQMDREPRIPGKEVETEPFDKKIHDKCLVFSCCQESAIAVSHAASLVNDIERAQTESMFKDVLQMQDASRVTRISLYAYIICTIPENDSDKGNLRFEHTSVFISILKRIHLFDKEKNPVHMNAEQPLCILEMLPPFYLPSFIAEQLTEDKIFFMKDLLVQSESTNKLIADKYSRIFMTSTMLNESERDVSEDILMLQSYRFFDNEQITALENIQLPSFNKISNETQEYSLAVAEGIICGIDSENALCWKICSLCKTEPDDSKASSKSKIFCKKCDNYVESKMCVELEVFLQNAEFMDFVVSVKLLEQTVFKYLPMQITEEFEGFDVDCILGQKFGPTVCFVRGKEKNQDSTEHEKKMVLEEVNLSRKFCNV